MSKKRSAGQPEVGAYKPNNLQWINPSPNSEDIEWLESNGNRYVELLFEFFEDLQEAERVSIKRDPQSTRWIAILFAGDSDSRNANCALSVRGAAPSDALILLAYFHQIRFEGEYPATSDGDKGRWG